MHSFFLTLLCGLFPLTSSAFSADLILQETFDRSLARLGTANLGEAIERCNLVDSPVRAGRSAIEVTLGRETSAHRTDFYFKGLGESFREGETYWYGFSILFPGDWEPDELGELCIQWILPAKEIGGPQLAIYLYGDEYIIRKRWAEPGEEGKDRKINSEVIWRGAITPDRSKWVDWVFQIKWSLGEDGFVRAWKNETQIFDNSGPNFYSFEDGSAPYFKFGIYKWPWKQSVSAAPSPVKKRVLYFDEFRIGHECGGMESVSPLKKR